MRYPGKIVSLILKGGLISIDSAASYCTKHHRQCDSEKGITKTHRRFQFRDPIHVDSRVERVSSRRLQDSACKFLWLVLGFDVFEFGLGSGRLFVVLQVECIIFFPFLEALVLERRECCKPPSIRLQVTREITRFCDITWTIGRSFINRIGD